jgi:hypothetical protein
MRHQRAFHFGGAHAVTGDVDHIIDAAGDPVIAVLVAAAAVAGEVHALIGGEVGLHEALMVAIDGAHLAGQLSVMTRLPSVAPSVICPRHRPVPADAEEGPAWPSRASGRRAGQRRDQDAAGFGLPPGVDDGAAAFADHIVIPGPGFRVDRLADRSEDAQG